ncbi:hypothetical protein [Neisseria sp. Ec49-e6-T10]|uniref:hypothetical protein n=1 Tax=Neisseria sp. Ec49-e6-T10 TaxID=3140744 RepID=UPI003EC0D72A
MKNNKNVRINQMLKMLGNVNKMRALQEEGYVLSTIASMFTDKGIPLSEEQVKAYIEAPEVLGTKAFKNKDFQELIRHSKEIEEFKDESLNN